jgi:hypothetical protein
VVWAPDGRLLYGALLRQAPESTSGLSAFARPAVGLYLTDAFFGLGQPISGEVGLVPLWRPDGARFVVGLPSGQGSGLRLRALDEWAPRQRRPSTQPDVIRRRAHHDSRPQGRLTAAPRYWRPSMPRQALRLVTVGRG